MWTSIKTGSWLTPERLRVYPGLLLFFQSLAIFLLVLTSDGRHDFMGRPLGADFAQVWIAGTEVLAGHPEAPFDPQTHFAAQQAFFGLATDVYGWHYPPYFLALATLLALLPYAAALAVWQLTTLPLYLAGILASLRGTGISGGGILVAALAFPAVFVNLGHGHNGFLTAGLFTGALLCLERRPWLAGALFGLLVYKPQFGLVIPVALVAGCHWRALIAASAGVLALTGLTLAGFGLPTWLAFHRSLEFTRTIVLEQGNTGWEKIQSVFSAVRMLGGSIDEAYVAQGLVAVGALVALAVLWRSASDPRLKYAALACAALLTTPYCLDYDMVLLGPAIAFMVALGLDDGFKPFDKSVLALVWVTPLLARLAAKLVFIPLGPVAMLAMFTLIMHRAFSRPTAAKLSYAPATRHIT